LAKRAGEWQRKKNLVGAHLPKDTNVDKFILMKRLEKIIRNLLEKDINPLIWIMAFLSMVTARLFLEKVIASSKPVNIPESIIEFLQTFYFFLLAFLLIWLILSFIFKLKPQKLALVLAYGLFLIILPPILDLLKTGGAVYWSFYLLSSPGDLLRQYVSIFGYLPSGIVYFGTKITFILTVLVSAGLVWILTKKIARTVFGAIAVYSALFFMGSFPTVFYYAYVYFSGSGKILNIHSFEIAGFFGTVSQIFGVEIPSLQYALAYRLDFFYFLLLILILIFFFYRTSREKFWAVANNLRFPQIIYHFGLFFVGMGLGILQYPQNFSLNIFSVAASLVLLASIWLSWEASVVVNDLNDFGIDQISNSARPLPRKIFTLEEYRQFGIICFLLAILGGLTVGPIFAIILIIYQIIAWFYSSETYRLKKYPGVATFVSSIALILILFLGFILMSDGQTIHTLSWRIILLLIITYTISIPLKDFKDISGDGKYGVWTIPVLFGEKKARLIIAANLFISYVLSVFFLNELRLFWWAIIFGTVSFLITTNKEIQIKKLLWYNLGAVSVYGIILVKIVFF
jgi:4-hydroxybenzoate polyprenyltransferase